MDVSKRCRGGDPASATNQPALLPKQLDQQPRLFGILARSAGPHDMQRKQLYDALFALAYSAVFHRVGSNAQEVCGCHAANARISGGT